MNLWPKILILAGLLILVLSEHFIRQDSLKRIQSLECAATNNAAQIRQLQQYGDKVGLCISNQGSEINEIARGLANLILLSHPIGAFTNYYRGPDGEEYWIRIDPFAPTNHGLRKL